MLSLRNQVMQEFVIDLIMHQPGGIRSLLVRQVHSINNIEVI
jgi:hypothetical protein